MKNQNSVVAFTGFPFFSTPIDVLEKLKYDLERMSASRTGSYAMYDFFITADNLCDWWTAYKQLKSFRGEHTLRRIVAQIANSAKHYRADNPRHQHVQNLFKDGYAEDGYVEEGYFAEHPTVALKENIADELGLNQSLALQELAKHVCEHWKEIIVDDQQQLG